MTLSICIPIYNYNATKLITDLSQQALKEKIEHEIILIDDNSDLYENENAQLATLPYTQLTRLPQNIGRSAIRNQLAKNARFEYILFMDCDAEIVDDFFIKRYMDAVQSSHADIIMGGCCYKKEQPASDYYLRWLYGIQREEKPAAERNAAPYRSFSAFNCLIKKNLFSTIQFDETNDIIDPNLMIVFFVRRERNGPLEFTAKAAGSISRISAQDRRQRMIQILDRNGTGVDRAQLDIIRRTNQFNLESQVAGVSTGLTQNGDGDRLRSVPIEVKDTRSIDQRVIHTLRGSNGFNRIGHGSRTFEVIEVDGEGKDGRRI